MLGDSRQRGLKLLPAGPGLALQEKALGTPSSQQDSAEGSLPSTELIWAGQLSHAAGTVPMEQHPPCC